MDFGFSGDQREIQQLAAQILGDLVTAERLAQYDEYAAERFDRDLWGKLAEAGLLGIAIGEDCGGMGFGFTELCLFLEEVGRTIAPIPAVPTLVSAALLIGKYGNDAFRQRLLPGVAAGETILTVALIETLDEDPAEPRFTIAEPDGEGYRVSGVKSCVPFAQDAAQVIVPARVGDDVVVVMIDPKAAGVTLHELRYTTFEPIFDIELDAVAVPAADVVVVPSEGRAAMRWIAERTIAAVCAMQVGCTDRALRMTASYTAERKQFGVPIATFQAVGHRAANCFIDVECLRLATYQAASRLDSQEYATTEVEIAKIWAGDTGHRVSYSAQHLHGGTGIDRDYPLWRFCLWMRHNEIVLGGSARQLAALGDRIAAGEAFCQ